MTNMTMLSDWANYGKPIKDPEERRDFGLDNVDADGDVEAVEIENEVLEKDEN